MEDAPAPTQNIPPEAQAFLEQLLEDSGQTAYTPELKQQVIGELYEQLDKKMTLTLVDAMPPEYIEDFNKMLEENKNQEEIQKFLLEKIPNAGELFLKAMDEFRSKYLQALTKPS